MGKGKTRFEVRNFLAFSFHVCLIHGTLDVTLSFADMDAYVCSVHCTLNFAHTCFFHCGKVDLNSFCDFRFLSVCALPRDRTTQRGM